MGIEMEKLVLVVDDNANIQKLIQINLEFEGYKTVLAGNGKEALEKIKKQEPALIILDIQMPILDGWGVLSELKREHKTASIPVIVLTGKGDNQDRVRGLEFGVTDYITKPFNATRLLEVVHKTLQRKPDLPAVIQEKPPVIRIAIADRNGKSTEIMQILLGNSSVEVVGFSTDNERSASYYLAKQLKLNVTSDPYALCKLPNLDLLFESSPGIFDLSKVLKINPNLEVIRGKSTAFILKLIGEKESKEARTNALVKELHDSRKRIELLLSQVVIAEEAERKRIAAEVHDSLAQSLVSALVRVQTCQSMMQKNDSGIEQELESLRKMMADIIKESRQIIFNLRPSTLDDLGLIPTLEHYLKKFETETGIKTSISAERSDRQISAPVETALYRIVQESLNNVKKHAGATAVKVQFKTNHEKLSLIISDNGKGFNADALPNASLDGESVGILGIKERVALLGGELQIEAVEGQGCKVTIAIPLG